MGVLILLGFLSLLFSPSCTQTCFIYFRETIISFERCFDFVEKKRISIEYEFNLLILQHPRGEILGQECVSCFYPNKEIANFKKRGENNATLILFVYPRVQPALYLIWYIRQRGVFVSLFILFTVFGDTAYLMSSTSLYAFLVSVNQIHY